jgi:hypothetical protein
MLRGNRLLANEESQLQKMPCLEQEPHKEETGEKFAPPPPLLPKTAEELQRRKNTTVHPLLYFPFYRKKTVR